MTLYSPKKLWCLSTLTLLAFSCDKSPSKSATLTTPAEPTTEKTLLSNDENQQSSGDIVYSKDSLVKAALDYQAKIKIRKSLLERERDRQGKLSAELSVNGEVGCFGEMTIDKLEIRIEGSWVGQENRGTGGGPRKTADNAYRVTYQFADDIKFDNDEKSTAVFVPGGRLITDQFAGKKIKDLKYLKFSKGGVAWSSVEECENNSGIKSVFGKDKKCHWRHYEVDSLQVETVKILVNDEVLYQNAGLEGKLQYQNLVWDDPAFTVNPAYIKMMQRTDCPDTIQPE